VEDMRIGRMAQDGTPRHPVRIEIIDDPIVPLHGRQLAHAMGQMRREILAGACAPAMPQPLPCGHHDGREPGPYTMADGLVLPFLRLPRLRRLWGICPLQDLHPSLFIRADHQAPVLREAQGVDLPLANVPRFRVKHGGVALEPIPSAMRFEVRCLQTPPEA
jgi:hypothetical protein